MFLIAGLGNPGIKYAQTRHNIGFWLVDMLSEDFKAPVLEVKHNSLLGKSKFMDKEFILVKPLTYMNRSGLAVFNIAREHNIEPENIMIIYDDMALPIGKIRLRPKGSSGGHNGIESIIFHLQTDEFNRLRVGIGDVPPKVEAKDFVLSSFNAEDEAEISDALARGKESVKTFMQEGIVQAMNRFN